MANQEFSTSFFFVQIGVASTAGATHQKMRMVPRVPNSEKNGEFFDFAVLRGWADSIPHEFFQRPRSWIAIDLLLNSQPDSISRQSLALPPNALSPAAPAPLTAKRCTLVPKCLDTQTLAVQDFLQATPKLRSRPCLP